MLLLENEGISMWQPSKKQKLDKQYEDCGSVLYPVLSSELTEPIALTEVYVDTILQQRNISKAIIDLNSILPISELNHLKRIKGCDILLLPADGLTPKDVQGILAQKHFDATILRGDLRKVSVAKIPPKTKEQHETVHKLWPCNFHSNRYIEKLCTNTLFDSKQLQSHVDYMRLAIDVAKFMKSPVGSIVVDPKINSVVAVGFDCRRDNPCQHAAMVAIDNVALTQNGGAWNKSSSSAVDEHPNLNGIPPTILEHCKGKQSNIKFGARKFKGKGEIETPSDSPYLCTGYSVYTTREPCIMCAMALIHSRAKRIFYGANSDVGGLGTLCKIHTVKDLNHHYEVFGALLKDECALLCKLS